MINRGVKVKCRRCGCEYFSDQLKLDLGYGMVVCNDCIRGRHVKEEVKKRRIEEKEAGKPADPSKPPDWDEDDFMLEKLAKQKENSKTVKFLAPGRVKCKKCSFKFNYDEFLNKPPHCPYCGLPIKK